eukprot:147166_1
MSADRIHMTHVTHFPQPISIGKSHFPQPNKLAWQWTSCFQNLHIPSSDCAFEVDPVMDLDAFAAPPTNPKIKSDENNILHTLVQYGQHTNYRIHSRMVMHGFIRDLQIHVTSIIPTDITQMCLLFYYDEANDLIHLAFRLYKQMRGKPVEGHRVLTLLHTDDLCSESDKQNTQILRELIQFKFMRIVSRKSTFSQLERCLNAKQDLCSALCTYQFMNNVSEQFGQYSNSFPSSISSD